MPLPRATARLQFHKDFGFADARASIPYFKDLGVSHLYASPIFTARRGSTHGYDVVDPGSINPELGGMAGLQGLVADLRAAGMGLIIDIVPNHMGIAGAENPWWQDMLEWGRSSRYATWFDIDWQREDVALRGKVLLPFLGQQYGDELKAGTLALQFDTAAGKIFLDYHGNRFPICPASYGTILGSPTSPLSEQVQAAFPGDVTQSRADEGFALLREVAADPAGLASIRHALASFSTGKPEGWAALHAVLEAQHYRLAWWRFGTDALNWRRFFEVTELAGIRTEQAPVFDAEHVLVLQLYEQGLIDGVRVDHVDGLADPTAYCRLLRDSLEARTDRRPAGTPTGPAYIVVEKILAAGEPLRPDWHVDGTTGYDFMDQVGAFLHAPQGAAALDIAWAKLTDDATGGAASHGVAPLDGHDAFTAEVEAARRLLLAQNLATEMDAACRALLDVARTDLSTRDYSYNAIKRVFTELLVQFPVYRTYVQDGTRNATDQAVFDKALDRARVHVSAADAPLLAQLDAWLGGAPAASADDFLESDEDRAARVKLRNHAIRRFQQLTPPLVAKSVEDTAFYRYGRLISRNQVGSDPGQFAMSADAFHAACVTRAAAVPHAMLATATHDHKRGEDVTARLAILSEVGEQWGSRLNRWRTMNARCKSAAHGRTGAPSAAEESMLYQTLVGIWPIGLLADDAAGVEALRDRLTSWQEKSLREAKASTDWVLPDTEYEAASREFLQAILRTDIDNLFLADVAEWVRHIAVAGIVNSLTQTVLRLTVPGVPDLYQGTEFWDLSLVDPDNRRPVDFEARAAALVQGSGQPVTAAPWQSGALKQRVVQALLLLRKESPALFADGDYLPLQIEGPQAASLFAFTRRGGGHEIVVIVSHLVAAITLGRDAPTIDPGVWADTSVKLPDAATEQGAGAQWHNLLGGDILTVTDNVVPAGAALAGMTVAILYKI